MALTNAERQERKDKKKLANGFVRFWRWVTPTQKKEMISYLAGTHKIVEKDNER